MRVSDGLKCSSFTYEISLLIAGTTFGSATHVCDYMTHVTCGTRLCNPTDGVTMHKLIVCFL
jgi:hypothetical protein